MNQVELDLDNIFKDLLISVSFKLIECPWKLPETYNVDSNQSPNTHQYAKYSG